MRLLKLAGGYQAPAGLLRQERKSASLCFNDLPQTSLSFIRQSFKDVLRGNKLASAFGLKRTPDSIRVEPECDLNGSVLVETTVRGGGGEAWHGLVLHPVSA